MGYSDLKFYMAPMEGITSLIYRNAYEEYFGNIDKYFTPFISPNTNGIVKKKDIKEVDLLNNIGYKVIPQVLTNNSSGFLAFEHKLAEMGHEEINLNIGCPAKTVITKGKGSGMLKDLYGLDHFLDEIFRDSTLRISIKTRIGFDSRDDWKDILDIYNSYPISELIIHPRLQSDYYDNKPDLDSFIFAVENSKIPLCYNGDIWSVLDIDYLLSRCECSSIMLGRGLVANPCLVKMIKGGEFDLKRLKAFIDKIRDEYLKYMGEEKNTLFHLKELWVYLIRLWPTANDRLYKQIKKSNSIESYNEVVNQILACPIEGI